MKKRKLPADYENIINKKANIEKETVCSSLPKLYSVLDSKFRNDVETEKFFVGKIISKKETNRLIKELSSVFPLEGKSFLKRVRWTGEKNIFEVLIRPLYPNEIIMKEQFSLTDVLGETKMNTTGLSDTIDIRDVPNHQAKTYSQFQEASKFWSVQFREDKYIERLLKDEVLSDLEKLNVRLYMKLCMTAAKYGDENVGCVVVDPCSNEVVAISHDRRHHHPLQHAVMVAADLVAKGQGGGAWDIQSEHIYHLPCTPKQLDAETTNAITKDTKKLSLPYLCTGYDLYVSREPCVMCAMALVHSRIRRVFYAVETSWGALGSHWKLHLQNGLNHHYEVFKVDMNEMSSDTVQKYEET